MSNTTERERLQDIMSSLHASKINFVSFQDGQCSESRLKSEIADFILAREQTLKHSSDILVDALKAREKKMLEEIERTLKDAQSSYHLSTDILASASIAISGIDYALATINKYKGE